MKNLISIGLLAVSLMTHAQSGSSTQETTSAPANVVNQFFDAYRNKQHEKVQLLLDPDVIWIQPGSNRIAGVKKSREEVLAMGKSMSELSAKTIQLAELKILEATGNSVACLLRWKATQPGGNTLDVENVDIYTVENNKIVSVKVYSANIAMEDNFWGK
jgi:uncharacterized protein